MTKLWNIKFKKNYKLCKGYFVWSINCEVKPMKSQHLINDCNIHAYLRISCNLLVLITAGKIIIWLRTACNLYS